ncbi:MAG TPA: PAS domain-containing protein, partial [Planctomycetaceae bacterium]|nr:PAS domain-containing protein [Planctomycetaceae bacterium]
MADLPSILIFGGERAQAQSVADALRERFQAVQVDGMEEALQLLRAREFAGVCLLDRQPEHLCEASLLPQVGGILSQIPDGLAILDVRLSILWTNRRFDEMAGATGSSIGVGFYDAFGAPEILGPDLSPFHTALGTGASAKSTLRLGEKTYYQVHATPVTSSGEAIPSYLVVSVRDISAEILQQQKL